jgi:hypothetical protein
MYSQKNFIFLSGSVNAYKTSIFLSGINRPPTEKKHLNMQQIGYNNYLETVATAH